MCNSLSVRRLPAALVACVLASSLCAQNDRCADATPLALGDSATNTTTGADSDGRANCGASENSPDRWHVVTPDRDCFIAASTCNGSTYDTVLSVHTACPGTAANQIACNDDGCGTRSTVGFDAVAGESYWIRVSGFSGDSGRYAMFVDCFELPLGNGPDLVVTDIRDLTEVDREAGSLALSLTSVVCNQGSEPVDWFANPNPNHPFLVFNLFRLEDGRLQQIGVSDAKHGFAVSQDNLCDGFCFPEDSFSRLGVGCSDLYGVPINAAQDESTYRSEINPWTGEFIFEGSHLDRHPPGDHGALEHRLRAAAADLDPKMHPGAQYFVELYIVSADDIDHTNSLGWKKVSLGEVVGGERQYRLAEGPAVEGSVLAAWTGASVQSVPDSPEGDGRSYVAVSTNNNGDGTWRYEYAVYNLDMDRGVVSFELAIDPDVAVENVAFHAMPSFEEGFSRDPWDVSRDGDRLRWFTSKESGDGPRNPLRWGTLYNFSFDADLAPGSIEGSIEQDSGAAAPRHTFSVGGPGPSAPFVRGDCNGDGSVDGSVTDAVVLLQYNFRDGPEPPCIAACDFDADGRVLGIVTDGLKMLQFLFAGDFPPAPPFPECGPGNGPHDAALGCNSGPENCQ